MAILFISSGVLTDAGGIEIVVEGGKVRIKRVPGWNPEIMAEITAAAAVLSHSDSIKDAGIRQQFEHVAQAVVERRAGEIQEYLGEAS